MQAVLNLALTFPWKAQLHQNESTVGLPTELTKVNTKKRTEFGGKLCHFRIIDVFV